MKFAAVVASTVAATLILVAGPVLARDILVGTSTALKSAIATAEPGDNILLRPGNYALTKVQVVRPGSEAAPITVRALQPGKAKIETASVELFKVKAPHWRFEHLDIRGGDDSYHAFHIAGDADNAQILGNRMVDFHAAIKGNPENGDVPDQVLIDGNVIYNQAPRNTNQPVTPIDVVGAMVGRCGPISSLILPSSAATRSAMAPF